MIEVNKLTKDELIANLWLTDEILNQIEITKLEIDKKKQLLDATITNTQQEHLKTVENQYYQSEVYKANKGYELLIEKTTAFKGVAILISLILSLLIGYTFIALKIKFIFVIIFWIITPFILYLLYQQALKYYLIKNKPEPLPTLDFILEETRQSYEFQQISNSLMAKHIRDEIKKMENQLSELDESLSEKTFLPELYRLRARDVVWYLENSMADNLKEALSALVEGDHREKVKQMIEEQNQEIIQLKEITTSLMENNQKLAHKIELQRQQLVELENKKK